MGAWRRYLATRLVAIAAGVAVVAATPVAAAAATVVATVPEFSGASFPETAPYPLPAVTVGTLNFVIPPGSAIVSATLSGTFGNSVIGNSAGVNVYFDGVPVATCAPKASCWDPFTVVREVWNFSFAPGDLGLLADGIGYLTAVQTNEISIQLGVTTLTIETRAVPLPAALPLFFAGVAALGLVARRRP